MPLTGAVASQGESERNAIEMAVENRNLQGGINVKKVELIFEDTTLSAQKAVSAFNKLYNIDGVKFFLGPSPSVEIAAIAPIIAGKDAIMINFGGGSSPYSKYGENAFTTSAVFGFEVPRMVEYIEKQNYKKVAFLGVNVDSVIQAQEIFQQELQNRNIDLVKSELVETSNKDFATSLLKVKESNPDAIYVLHFPAFMGMLFKSNGRIRDRYTSFNLL
ncbi:ABC transporter substrate-binding protein [Patescibacteria group bacterium]|nr:ABC transporter substrate-binding protein [Patescibacteria group bacterium]